MNEDNNKHLRKYYYDPASTASFSNEYELKKAAVTTNGSLPMKTIKSWMSQQLTHSLHKPARKRFPRNRYFVRTPGELAQADIADMSMFADQNNGFKYLLTFIDVFSKKAFVEAMKTKSGDDVQLALSKIFKLIRTQSLQTDRGTEFTNEKIRQYCKDCGVNLFYCQNQDVKCAVIERFNRTLKGRMFKYFTAYATRKYIDILPQLVAAYNNTRHSTIKMAPNEVTDSNTDQVFSNTYGYASPREYLVNRVNVERTKFKVGDRVRVKYTLTSMDKGYYPNWSDMVFKITAISEGGERDMYEIVDEMNAKMPRRYYTHELQKVDGDPVYRVEKVIKQSKGKSLVKWLNHPEQFNSWINSKDVKNIRNFTSRNSD